MGPRRRPATALALALVAVCLSAATTTVAGSWFSFGREGSEASDQPVVGDAGRTTVRSVATTYVRHLAQSGAPVAYSPSPRQVSELSAGDQNFVFERHKPGRFERSGKIGECGSNNEGLIFLSCAR